MANSVDKVAKSFSRSFRDASKKKTVGYDTPAIVTRISGKTAWVHIPGGVDETPVSLTLSAKAGDEVQVRVSGGRAWLTGNTTAPPTDDRTAVIAQKKAESVGTHVEALATQVAIIDSAYISEARVNTLLADYATITELHSDYISANTIEATYATITDLHTNYAQITLANLDTANINTAKIKDLFVQVGLIKDAVISGAKITGYLDAVEVNAANITAGTLIADRIAIRGSTTSLVYALNNYGQITSTQTNTIDGYILTQRTVNADKIIANSITGNEIAANTITAFNIVGSNLSAIYADLGEITAGVLKSSNYSYSSGNFSTAGMMIDLNNKLIRTPKSALDANGKLYATGAEISGNITVGGANNSNGTITVKDASNGTLGTWDNSGLSLLYTSSGRYITFGASGNRGYLEYDSFYNRFVAPKEIGWSLNSYDKAQVSVMSTSANTGSLILRAYDASDNAYGFMINPTDGIYAIGNITATGSVIFSNTSVAHIYFANNLATVSMIRFLPASDAYGHGISIGGGGATIIGGGESATACQGLLSTYGDERMIIANDGNIEFYDNCQNGTSSAYKTSIESGSLYVGSDASTDTVMHQVVARNAVANAAVHVAVSGNHGLYSNTKASWIIYCVSSSSDNVAYIPRNLNVSGNVTATVSSGEANVVASNGTNKIYLYANTSGTVGIYSYSADGTGRHILARANNSSNITTYGNWGFSGNISINGGACYIYAPNGTSDAWVGVYGVGDNLNNNAYLQSDKGGTITLLTRARNGNYYNILRRANNSHAITAYGDWTFDGTLACKNYSGNAGRPVTSVSTNGKQVSAFECYSSTSLRISGQWGTTGTTFAWRYATVSTSASDIRLKENVADCTITALPLINSIRMREFDWKQDGRHQNIGFIADELEELDSKLAIGGGYDDGIMNVKSVDTFYLIGYLVKAVQELSAEVNRLKGEMYEESGNSRNRLSIHC